MKIAGPSGEGELLLCANGLGYQAEWGAVAAGFVQPPTSLHHLMLNIATTQAVTAIQNSLLVTSLEAERQTLQTLNETGAALSAQLELEALVQKVTDAGVEVTGAEFGAFFYNVLDQAGESYMLYTLSGVPREAFSRFPMPRNTAVFGPTFKGEGVVSSDDITQDPRYGKNEPYYGMPKGHLPVVSYLAVPVIGREGEVIGGLFFGHSEKARFTERHEQLMSGIAAQAAVAIDNARLYHAAQQANETLELRVAEAIAETEADSPKAMGQVMKLIQPRISGRAEGRRVAAEVRRQLGA